jgi:hypothetical protein
MRFFRFIILFAVVFGLLALPTAAKNPDYTHGEVIYHQDFSEVSDFSKTGIQKGSASSPNSLFFCADGSFRIQTYDDGRVYAILPHTDWTEDFTVEFDFSFQKTANSNGYLAVMLTSAGEEPSNISQLIFRIKGTVDDFEAPSEEMAKSIRLGEQINVKIPVKNGVVKSLTLSANGITEELDRTSLLLIGSGSRGFSVRNADVDISEIYIVNGTDYGEKLGYWAEHSYAESVGTDVPSNGGETAPETGDSLAVMAGLTAFGAVMMMKHLRKRKCR